jgi:hypothetical protein
VHVNAGAGKVQIDLEIVAQVDRKLIWKVGSEQELESVGYYTLSKREVEKYLLVMQPAGHRCREGLHTIVF